MKTTKVERAALFRQALEHSLERRFLPFTVGAKCPEELALATRRHQSVTGLYSF